jgi:hypothetical protein
MPSNSPNEGTPSFLSPAMLIGLVFSRKTYFIDSGQPTSTTKLAYHLALRIEQE